MSELAAALARNGRVDEGDLDALTRPARLPSPEWRFEVLDGAGLAAGGRPGVDPPGVSGRRSGVVVACDGRIDNGSELARHLQRPELASPEAITELVGAVVEHWGIAGLERLIGDWAVVALTTDELIAARDPTGQRPLYWCDTGDRVLFASAVAPLVAQPDVAADLDLDVVDDWLVQGWRLDARATWFRSVRALAAGNAVVVHRRSGAVAERSFHQWRARDTGAASLGEAAEELRPVLARAVRDRQSADSPTGLLLSGGLDSSALAATADRDRLRAYTFGFADRTVDERSWTRSTAARLGLRLREVDGDAGPPFSVHDASDEPDGGNDYDRSWVQVEEDLAAAGGTTLLTGYGGETLFLSQSDLHLAEFASRGRLDLLLWAWRRDGYGVRFPFGDLARAIAPRRLRQRWPVGGAGPLPPWVDARPEAHRRRAFRHREARVLPTGRFGLAREVALQRLVATGSAVHLWASLTDSGRRQGVEYAHPYLDRRLIELVLGLPLKVFFAGDEDRAVLRAVVGGDLPETVVRRRRQTRFDRFHEQRLAAADLDVALRGFAPGVGPQRSPAPLGPASVWLALYLRWHAALGGS